MPSPVVSLSLNAKVEAVAGEGGGAGRLEIEEIGANQACRMANCLFFVHFCHVCQTHPPTPLSGRKSYLCHTVHSQKMRYLETAYLHVHIYRRWSLKRFEDESPLYAGGESGQITFSGHEPHEHLSLSLTPDIVRAKKSADNKSRPLEWARYTTVYLRSFLAISHFSLYAPRT